MFRDAWCLESNDESISIPSVSRVVSDCDVCYVGNPLGFQLIQSILFVTVNKWTTPDDSLAGVQSPVRACCDRAASQVVQLVDYAALDRRRNFEEEIAISERPDSFDGTHCAAYCLVQNKWRKF